MKAFQELSNRGRALRLRKMAFKALERYDLEVSRLRLVTNELNAIFRVDSLAGERYILRIALPEAGHNIRHHRSEMAWLAALRAETDLSVPQPLATRDGEYVIEVECEGVPEPRCCMIFSWVPGVDLAERLSETNVEKLGRLSAQLHSHAATFKPPEGFDILRFETVFPFPGPVVLFEVEHQHLLPGRLRSVYQEAIDWGQAVIDNLKADGEAMRVIHGDLHQWNVRVSRGLLSPIDFEDMMWGWPVQDIAISLYYFLTEDRFLMLRAAFQRGYTSHSPWPERYPGEIDALIAARGVDLANFVLQDPNPDWHAKAPAYIKTIGKRVRKLLEAKHAPL